MRKSLYTLLLTFICCFSLTTPVFAAYNADSYQHDTEGEDEHWYVTDYHGAPNTVELFVVVQPKYDNYSSLMIYDFLCANAEFSTGITSAEMYHEFHIENDPYAVLDYGNVYETNFGIEDGTYNFQSTTLYTLPLDLSDADVDLSTPELYDKLSALQTIIMPIGKDLRIYALAGDRDWYDETAPKFKNWAKGKEADINPELRTPQYNNDAVPAPTTSYYPATDTTHIVLTKSKGEEDSMVEEDCIFKENTCMYCGNKLIEESTKEVVSVVPEETKTNSQYVFMAGGIAVLVILAFIAKKRR